MLTGFSWIYFLISFACTALFVGGTGLIGKGLAEGSKGQAFQAGLSCLLGVALKFPVVILWARLLKTSEPGERTGAIFATCLVYFLAVAGWSIHGYRQNLKHDE
jgi:uncharacterized membrane protein YhaH (DUF805 family)